MPARTLAQLQPLRRLGRRPGTLVTAMVAAAPTLVYDHAATHQINLDPDWRPLGQGHRANDRVLG
jgi:hypothetical protein